MTEQIQNLKNVITELKTLRKKSEYLTHISHDPINIGGLMMPVNSLSTEVSEAVKSLMISEFWLTKELHRLEDIEDPTAFIKREQA